MKPASARTRRLARQADTTHVADMAENQYQSWIELRARERGWALQFHVMRSQVKGRWVTNTSAVGVPDLWLVHPGGAILVFEVKSEKGKATPEQLQWIASLQNAGVAAYVVRPSDAVAVMAKLDREA